jgi:hypothetical protein
MEEEEFDEYAEEADECRVGDLPARRHEAVVRVPSHIDDARVVRICTRAIAEIIVQVKQIAQRLRYRRRRPSDDDLR